MRSAQKTFALWAILAVVSILLFQMYEKERQTMIKNFDYPKFHEAVKNKHIESVTFNKESGEIEGEIKEDFVEKYEMGYRESEKKYHEC